MKLAILSDIHGNSEALKRTLDVARKSDVERLLILGDLVGYYYDAKGVLEQLQQWQILAIAGNHEKMLGAARGSSRAAEAYRLKYGSGLDVALETLDTAGLDMLTSLPSRDTIAIDGITFELCHGAPDDPDRYVYPTASELELAACEIPGSVVLMGHTHYPMVAARKNCLLLNAGSVGQSRDLGSFASWMIFDTRTRMVTPVRTAYRIDILAAEARRRDPQLPYLSQILSRHCIAP